MGIAYRIDTEIGITYTVYDGIIGESDIIQNETQIVSDPDWPPRRKLHLSDVTGMVPDPSLPQATISDMAEIWRENAKKLDGFKIAVIATGTFDQSAQLREAVSPFGSSLIVFNLLETACMWLGMDVEHTEQVLKELREEARGTS